MRFTASVSEELPNHLRLTHICFHPNLYLLPKQNPILVMSCEATGGHTAPLSCGDHPLHQSFRRPLCVYSTSSGLHRNPADRPLLCLQWWWVVLIAKATCPPAPARGNETHLPWRRITRYNAKQQLQLFIIHGAKRWTSKWGLTSHTTSFSGLIQLFWGNWTSNLT